MDEEQHGVPARFVDEVEDALDDAGETLQEVASGSLGGGKPKRIRLANLWGAAGWSNTAFSGAPLPPGIAE